MAEIFVIQIIKITGYFCNETKAPRFKGGWLISTISGRNLVEAGGIEPPSEDGPCEATTFLVCILLPNLERLQTNSLSRVYD